MSLEKIVESSNPKVMRNGQIRITCPIRENHTAIGRKGGGEMSMFLSPDINRYHCFSCGAKGALTRLLNKYYGLSIFEAMQYVKLFPVERKKKEFELPEAFSLKPPKMYLDRGYSEEILNKFKVGVTDKNWIAIPFYENDMLIGVRYMIVNRGERFVETHIEDKGSFIYNYDKNAEEAVIVEGESDVWRIESFGIHAEALVGSSFSKEQAEKLSKHKRIYVATDMDTAGRKAAELINYRMSHYETEVLFVPYEAKDPGEIRSAKEWKNCMKQATGYVEYYYEMMLHWEDYKNLKETAIRKAKFEY